MQVTSIYHRINIPITIGTTLHIMNYQADNKGYYGEFGGAYIPELLRKNIDELENAYLDILESEDFKSEYAHLLDNYVGRPTPLTFATNLSAKYQTQIYLKREDFSLLHPL